MTKPNPYDWHYRPKGSNGPCPICGFWKRGGEHRAIRPDENRTGRWLLRKRRRGGKHWYESLSEQPPRKKSGPKPGTVVRQPGPTPRVRSMMAKAAQLVAAGKPLQTIAKALHVGTAAVVDWRRSHPELWDAALNAAQSSLVDIVRKAAGTDAILKDPDGFIAMAEQADKWCEKHGQELFPGGGEVTLTTFYRDFYQPNCMIPDASDSYRKFYEIVVRRWRLITGDPPLEKM